MVPPNRNATAAARPHTPPAQIEISRTGPAAVPVLLQICEHAYAQYRYFLSAADTPNTGYMYSNLSQAAAAAADAKNN